DDADPGEVLREAAAVATEAIERTRDWVAKRGRQSFTGERSIGSPDPGIVAVATMLNDLCKTVGVQAVSKASRSIGITDNTNNPWGPGHEKIRQRSRQFRTGDARGNRARESRDAALQARVQHHLSRRQAARRQGIGHTGIGQRSRAGA